MRRDDLPADLRARAQAHGLFAHADAVCVARAPGRLDVMGGIADYSGSLVLQLPLLVEARALAAPRYDDEIRVVSHSDAGVRARLDLALRDFRAPTGAELLRQMVADEAWPFYLIGAVLLLGLEHGTWPRSGFDLLVTSEVPEGKGVASSAAVAVASTAALVQAMALDLPNEGAPAAGASWSRAQRRALALLCQRAENRVVGAACGVMDQMTSACGRQGELLRLLCQPAEIEGHVAIPPGFAFWGIDSGVRHAVSGSDYTAVRTGAFMGLRILAELQGLEVQRVDDRVEFTHPRWGRYLANVSLAEWHVLGDLVPEHMRGDEFVQRYGGTSDQVTRVDQQRTYAVRQPTAHPIFEHERVRTFAALLPRAADAGVPEVLGALMHEAHASYSACGLGSDATDALVAAVREVGSARGLFGAKITGGGSGGTVAVFGRADREPLVQAIAGARLVLRASRRS